MNVASLGKVNIVKGLMPPGNTPLPGPDLFRHEAALDPNNLIQSICVATVLSLLFQGTEVAVHHLEN